MSDIDPRFPHMNTAELADYIVSIPVLTGKKNEKLILTAYAELERRIGKEYAKNAIDRRLRIKK